MNGDYLIMGVDFNEIEKSLFEGTAKLNFGSLKLYVAYLKENFLQVEREKINNITKFLENDSRKNVQALADSLNKFFVKKENEIIRVKDMYSFDRSFGNYIYLAGVDEVGRGPLAGPIAAASVVLSLKYKEDTDLILGIKDSKKLSPKHREELAEIIKKKAIAYNIALINNNEIDERGISWCNNEVLRRAVKGLKIPPDIALSDGYAVKNLDIHNEFVIKGDAKSASIACASIIAKVYRDNLMKEYSKLYPQYGFDNNAGYGTNEHVNAIKEYGVCKIHRMSFLKNII
ncbi:ribonuclease HII [Clostridium magnum DSM 2767]|uniref:Ribonuclease HII n=2 Tax=Clostridium magnum TaxID=33954 RepID=A0A162V1H8_9CLOT|nr:ribonuclease HII [Clostridium magnum DSM 2767]SHI21950.1 RNase HII [Clostridium magnum DSM 2767]